MAKKLRKDRKKQFQFEKEEAKAALAFNGSSVNSLP